MTGISPTPERPPIPNDQSRDWYYRLGERERGPMTLAQLTELVASSGDVAREIVVRQHAEGEWLPYETLDPVTARRLRADRLSPPLNGPVAARGDVFHQTDRVRAVSSLSQRRLNLRERLRANWQIVVGVLVWASINVVLWNVLDPFQRTDRRYFQIVSDAAQKAREAHAQGLDEAARGRLAASVVRDLKPIVADLNKSASASQPIRQHLMWAAKDQLPKLFSASGKELNECDSIFQWHMYEAGRRLGIDVPRPMTSIVFP